MRHLLDLASRSTGRLADVSFMFSPSRLRLVNIGGASAIRSEICPRPAHAPAADRGVLLVGRSLAQAEKNPPRQVRERRDKERDPVSHDAKPGVLERGEAPFPIAT